MSEEKSGQQETGTDQETQDAGGADGQDGGRVEFSEEQQAALDRIIAERLTRAKDKWDKDLGKAQKAAAKEAAKEVEEAEAERLKEQQEFEKLAEKRAERVTALEGQVSELTGAQERLGAYQEAVEGLLAGKVEALGEGAAAAVEGLPGEPDALARLQWLASNEGLFAKEDKGAGLGTPGRRAQQRAKTEQVERRPYRRPTL